MKTEDLIYELVKKVDARQEKHEDREREFHGKVDKRLQTIEENLEYHIKRTDILQDWHEENKETIEANKEVIDNHATRIDDLEKPGKFLSTIKKIVITVGSLAAAIYATYRLVDYL